VASRSAPGLKEREGLVEPEQLDQTSRRARRVEATASGQLQIHLASQTNRGQDFPPFGDDSERLSKVRGASDKRGAIEYTAVNLRLPSKPPQRVPIRFDLVPVKPSIDDGQVNADLVTAKPQLLDERRIEVALKLSADAGLERAPDLRVPQKRSRADRLQCGHQHCPMHNSILG